MSPRRPLLFSLLALSLLLAGCRGGQTLRVYEENDRFFGGTDRFYTQGAKVEYTTALARGYDVPVVTPAARSLLLEPGVPSAAGSEIRPYAFQRRFLGLAAGQQIFTPEDISDPGLREEDRPYAGWLYGSVSLHNVSFSHRSALERPVDPIEELVKNREDRLDSFELQAGIVGPSSLAEDTQTWFHDLIGVEEPEGWDHQLDDEPGVSLSYSRKHRNNFTQTRLFGLQHDLLSNVGGSLGNVHTHLQVGGLFRFGHALRRDFGLAANVPDLDLSQVVAPELLRERKEDLEAQFGKGFSWYGFFGVDGRVVLQNIFLDGNTFSSSHSVDKEYFVADFQAGLAFQWTSLEISYTQFVRTPEFRRTSDPQVFGLLQVAWRF